MNPEQLNFNHEPNSTAQKESKKSEKEILWEQKLAEVNRITDGLGRGIDEKIKEAVAAFLIHEFTTSGSCEGHIAETKEDEHGLPFPWVEFYAPEPEGWEENEDKKQEWIIENLKQQQKMKKFFEEFYRKRETSLDAQLTLEGIGIFEGFRIQSSGAEMMATLAPEEQKQKLELYRKEMADFTKFLKDKYFLKESPM